MPNKPAAIHPESATSPWPCVHGVTSEQVDRRWEQAIALVEIKGTVPREGVGACECCARPTLDRRWCSDCLPGDERVG